MAEPCKDWILKYLHRNVHFCSHGPVLSAVVKALCYKTRWAEWISSIYLILLATLGPGVYTASNRNEYQGDSWGIECGRCVGLTTLPPSVSRLSRQCWILNISEPYRPAWPVTGIALLYGDGACFLWGTNWTASTATSSQYLTVNCEPIV
jgi:hypothetical protein